MAHTSFGIPLSRHPPNTPHACRLIRCTKRWTTGTPPLLRSKSVQAPACSCWMELQAESRKTALYCTPTSPSAPRITAGHPGRRSNDASKPCSSPSRRRPSAGPPSGHGPHATSRSRAPSVVAAAATLAAPDAAAPAAAQAAAAAAAARM